MRRFACLAVLLPGLWLGAGAAPAQNVIVTSDQDFVDGDTSSVNALLFFPGFDGVITLREAIEASNNTPGANAISFCCQGAIELFSPLPSLSDASGGTTIDGGGGILIDGFLLSFGAGITITSANNALLNIVFTDFETAGIVITGAAATNNVVRGCGVRDSGAGLIIQGASNNIIGGALAGQLNIFSGNQRGLLIDGPTAAGNTVAGNFIGVGADGFTAFPNAMEGVLISNNANNNRIGGTANGEGNLISANGGDGVAITTGASNNRVQGNVIGTVLNGTQALPNGISGVLLLGGGGNLIGGTQGGINLISGNAVHGIEIEASSGNTIAGNYIGTALNGQSAIPNQASGIQMTNGANGNIVGGASTAARNIISGNVNAGIEISGSGTDGNSALGNYIGVNADGTAAIPNGLFGVLISDGAEDNTIGGAEAGTGNIISGNVLEGISIGGSGTSGNNVFGNFVGLSADGNSPLGNGRFGIAVFGDSQANVIGAPGAGNVISANGLSGVAILNGSSQNVIQANFIGTNAAASASLGNLLGGVDIFSGAFQNLIGGNTAGTGNIISGNADSGISILEEGSNDNVVMGNYIGTDVSGNLSLGNGVDGVSIGVGAKNNRIGGVTGAEGNLISGNFDDGVQIANAGTTGNIVQSNYIGTNSTGDAAVPNSDKGVVIFEFAEGNLIGGDAPGAGNVISANRGIGVAIQDKAAFNTVQGNIIGANATATELLGNEADGVAIFFGANNNLIGGTSERAGNLIVGSGIDGVSIDGPDVFNIEVRRNSIFLNTGKGIALLNGGNGGIEAPFLTALEPVRGIATPNATIEIFADLFDEGEVFLAEVQADSNGEFFANVNLTELVGIANITATATVAGGVKGSGLNSTTEFSPPRPVGDDNIRPAITLIGNAQITLDCGAAFTDPGAQALDNVDGNISANIVRSGTVDTATRGIYVLSYNVSDAAGNAATEVRRTVVVDGPACGGAQDQGRQVFVSTTGNDATGDGSQGNPWRSIAFAIAQAGPFGTPELPLSIRLAPGTYAERIAFAPNIRIIGGNANDPAVTIIQPPEAAIRQTSVAMEAAQNTGLEDLTVQLPLDAPSNTTVLRINNVNMAVQNVVINGRDVTPSTGINILGPGSSGTLVRRSFITRVDNGIRSVESAANVANNRFEFIRFDAVFAREPEGKQGAPNVNPVLGDAARANDSGLNSFDRVDGFFIRNVNPTELKAENNDWGRTESAQIAEKMRGSVDFEPFLGAAGAVLPATVAVTVEDAATRTRILNATATLAGSGFQPQTANVNGVYVFAPVTNGNYTVNVSAPNFQGAQQATAVAAGEQKTVYVTVNRTGGGDTTAPVITRVGPAQVNVACNQAYTDAGATATDNVDGNITARIRVTGLPINIANPGTYTVTYNVSDNAGNAAMPVTRTVVVEDTQPPVVTLNGSASVTLNRGQSYTDAGATATDACDGNLTAQIQVAGLPIDTNVVRQNTITYSVTDRAGRTGSASRIVNVVGGNAPVITRTGPANVTIECGDVYVDAGATAQDTEDGNLTNAIVTGGLPINTGAAGTFTVTYNVRDRDGNAATQVTRTVNVRDTQIPVVTINGANPLNLTVGAVFNDPGASAQDACEGALTAESNGAAVVNTGQAGTYTVTYTATDGAGNAGTATRSVVVQAAKGCAACNAANTPLKDSLHGARGDALVSGLMLLVLLAAARVRRVSQPPC